MGGSLTGQALSTLAPGGVLTTLGYSAGRIATIDLTDLIWKRAHMRGFSLFAQSSGDISSAWSTISSLLVSQKVKPVLARTYPLEEAETALRYLIEDRPFGRVVLLP